jgi:hypothetical protein
MLPSTTAKMAGISDFVNGMAGSVAPDASCITRRSPIIGRISCSKENQ